MNTKEKMSLLKNYISSNVAPILVDFLPPEAFSHAVIIPANCSRTILNGHYEQDQFLPPDWYRKLTSQTGLNLLVIADLDSIPKEEQTKFNELLTARQISTFKLPQNTVIIVTVKKSKEETINEQIYSLMVHI